MTPASLAQRRTANGVNEYETIDPDGPLGPQLPVSLLHDAAGNLIYDPTAANVGDPAGSPSGQVYAYDEENRLTTVRRGSDDALLLEIRYDALGRRVQSEDALAAGDPCGGVVGLTRHGYAGLETLEEHLSCDAGVTFTLAREFVWGDRFPQPLAMVTHGGPEGSFGGEAVPENEAVFHYLHDILGSVVALTDSAGRVVERYTYDPYGEPAIEPTDPATGLPLTDVGGEPGGGGSGGGPLRLAASGYGNPFLWTGQRYDAGVRLYHFLYRGYSPRLGRWLQRDPLGYVDGVGLYGYVSASPLSWIDPLGLDRWYQGLGHTYIVVGPIDGVYYRIDFTPLGGGGFFRVFGTFVFAWNVGVPGEVVVRIWDRPDGGPDVESDARTDLALVRMFLDNDSFWYHLLLRNCDSFARWFLDYGLVPGKTIPPEYYDPPPRDPEQADKNKDCDSDSGDSEGKGGSEDGEPPAAPGETVE